MVEKRVERLECCTEHLQEEVGGLKENVGQIGDDVKEILSAVTGNPKYGQTGLVVRQEKSETRISNVEKKIEAWIAERKIVKWGIPISLGIIMPLVTLYIRGVLMN